MAVSYTHLDVYKRQHVEVDDGHMRLLLSQEEAQRAQTLLKGFELHMVSLSEDYPENVKVKYGGVRNA